MVALTRNSFELLLYVSLGILLLLELDLQLSPHLDGLMQLDLGLYFYFDSNILGLGLRVGLLL